MAPLLRAPSGKSEFARLAPRIRTIGAHRWVRVSRYDSGEPFFGHSAANRFDDPARRFGTCYLGFDVLTAVAETVLHDEVPVQGRFKVAQRDFEGRQIVRFPGGGILRLANFTGTALKALVGDGSISTMSPYDPPQQWAAALHAHPARVDGIYYVSRHLNDRKAVVVFDRARAQLGTACYEPMWQWRGLRRLRHTLHIDYAAP